MVVQAYVDESEGPKGGVFVLAGIVSTAEQWAKFSAEWERMLRHGTLSSRNDYHFKIDEMLDNDERVDRIAWFNDIIKRHATLYLSLSFSKREHANALSRITAPGLNIDWGHFANPYLFGFRRLMDMFHEHREVVADYIPPNEVVDFYFDEKSDKKSIRKYWDDYMGIKPPNVRRRFGNKPRFAQDHVVLPLQAADFWAGWIRMCREGKQQKFVHRIFKGSLDGLPHLDMSFREDQMTEDFGRIAARYMTNGKDVTDAKTGMVLGGTSSGYTIRDMRKKP